jgi:Ca-activated chloride channel family protein
MRNTKYKKETKPNATRPRAGTAAVSGAPQRAFLLLLSCVSCISWFLVCPFTTRASPSSALREYNAGKYDQALKEYERLLEKRSDDPRLHFNTGTAAYRNQQFEEAAKQFNATLASPDLKLQGLAYYNEGNALYHLGERAADPKQRTESWEKALQGYQSAMKLNGQDPDAKFNYEFVKKRLEELKQQQQQSKNDKSDQQKNPDQQQQQNQQQQQQQDQQKKDEQQQQQAQQNQSQQKQDESKQQQQAEQKKQEEQKQAANQAQEEKDKQQQAQQSAEQQKDKGDEKDQEEAAAQAAGQMTQQQAEQLLDAQKGEEQMLPVQPKGKPQEHARSVKDW